MKRIIAIVLVTLRLAAGTAGIIENQLPQLAGFSLGGQPVAENIQKPGHDALALTGYDLSELSVAENIQKPGHDALALTGYSFRG